jgi:hypothetical protein
MTDPASTIEIPDFVTLGPPAPRLPVLARLLADLLTRNTDLPQPQCASLSSLSDIDLQFPGTPDTFDAMAAWAGRVGGTVTAEAATSRDGTCVRAEIRFAYETAPVKGYAYITATG